MISEISYYILMGVLSFTNGSPAYGQDVYFDQNQFGLKKLLEDLYKQGNYDISLSHHEDGPSSHHEDIAEIIYKSQNQPSNFVRDSDAKPVDNNIVPSLTNIQSLNVFYRKKPTSEVRNGEENITGDCTQRWGTCSDIMWKDTKMTRIRKDDNNIDDILEFLNALNRYLEENRNYNYELRCYGNSCGRNDDFYRIRNDYYDRKKGYNRNSFNHNSRNSNDYSNRYRNTYSNYRNTNNNKNINNNYNRNTGDYYNKNRDDYSKTIIDNYNRINYDKYNRNDDYDGHNENYNRYNLRCKGNRCNRDESSYRDNLRCVGDRCGRSRDVRMERDNLRCLGDLCGRIMHSMRCRGDKCGRSRNNRDSLRCIGDRCSRRTDERDENDSNENERYIDGDDRAYKGNIYIDKIGTDDQYDRGRGDRAYKGNMYIDKIGDNDQYDRDGDTRAYKGNIYIDKIDDDDDDDQYDRSRDERDNIDDDIYQYSRGRDDTDNYYERDDRDDRGERDDRNNRYDSDVRDNRDDRTIIDDSGDRDTRDERDNSYERDDKNHGDGSYDRDDDGILRCLGNKCSRYNRDDDHDIIINNFRCVGNQCSRLRNDGDDDGDDIDGTISSRDDDADRYYRDISRCIGNKCARNRYDEEETKRQDSDKMDTTFEISGVDNVLTNLNNLQSNLGAVKAPDNIDLDRLLKDRERLLNRVKKLLTQNN